MKVNGTWKWINGKDLTYTNGAHGEPNGGDGYCIQVWNAFADGEFYWNDEVCHMGLFVVCEYDL